MVAGHGAAPPAAAAHRETLGDTLVPARATHARSLAALDGLTEDDAAHMLKPHRHLLLAAAACALRALVPDGLSKKRPAFCLHLGTVQRVRRVQAGA